MLNSAGRSLRLFQLVEEYAALGWHRSGSEVDAATASWMAAELQSRGVQVEQERVPFDRPIGDSVLTVDGVAVDHLPIFDAWSGSAVDLCPTVRRFDARIGGYPAVLDEVVAAAFAGPDKALVLATEHPDGSLVAINRPSPFTVSTIADSLPTVLVAGRDAEQLMAPDADVRLTIETATTRATTFNLVGLNAAAEAEPVRAPLMLTTPLNGWFGCAGERGTGIAVLLDLVETLADIPLLLVATGGHELSYFGARVWSDRRMVDEDARALPGAIVHIGASIAVEEASADPPRSLIQTRMGMCTEDEEAVAWLNAAMAPAGIAITPNTTAWRGEGEVFHELERPLLSFTGAGRDFHTPEDTAARSTSPESLRVVADAVADAARLLYIRATG